MTNPAFTLTLCLFIGVCSCKHIFVINSDPAGAKDDLVSVVVLYRHGDRSPFSSFPSDPYINSSYWPEGYGELLNKGMLRQYTLGKWLRTRYDNFLPADYSPKDIRVYSTDIDRALMSAQANLAGLYPPTDSQIWEDDFLWEPIPVHLMGTDDPVFAMNSECPKFDELQTDLETLDFFKNIYAENKDLFRKLSDFTGMDVSSISQVQMIYDVIYVYRNHNESYVPDWAGDVDAEKVTYLAGLEFGKATFTEELRRLRAGPFFDYLINYFSDTVNNVTDVTKFLMLSGHDTTISTVLGGMQAFDYYPPDFASTVIWELRKNTKKDYYINVLYKRNDTDTYDQITVNKCDFDCPFKDFQTNLASVSIDSATWTEACKASYSIRIIFSWSLLFITVLLQLVL